MITENKQAQENLIQLILTFAGFTDNFTIH